MIHLLAQEAPSWFVPKYHLLRRLYDYFYTKGVDMESIDANVLNVCLLPFLTYWEARNLMFSCYELYKKFRDKRFFLIGVTGIPKKFVYNPPYSSPNMAFSCSETFNRQCLPCRMWCNDGFLKLHSKRCVVVSCHICLTRYQKSFGHACQHNHSEQIYKAGTVENFKMLLRSKMVNHMDFAKVVENEQFFLLFIADNHVTLHNQVNLDFLQFFNLSDESAKALERYSSRYHQGQPA